MFVKVYQYHIQKEKVDEFLEIQEKVSEIYGRYLDFHTVYLNSNVDATKWIEISRYKDEDEFHKSMDMINKEKEIQDLFKAFQCILVTDKSEIIEEDFIERKEKSSF